MPEPGEVDALAGHDVHRGEHVGAGVLALGRAAASTAWALVTLGRQLLPTTPAKMMSVAWPSSVGPSTDRATLAMPKSSTTTDQQPVRAAAPQQPLGGALEVLQLLGRHAAGHHPAPAPQVARAAGRGPRPWPSVRRSRPFLAVGRGVGHAAASCSVSWDRTISRYVGVGVHQLGVGAGADHPAVVEHDDPVGVADGADPLRDDDHGRVGDVARSARPAAPRRWRSRGPRTSRRTGRSPAGAPAPGRSPGAAAGRRRRWCRPGRSARPGRPPSARRSRGPARPRAPATAPRRSRPGCRTAGWRRPCR